MITDPDEIKKLEEFLDALPETPEESEDEKLLWTVWARLYPLEAEAHMGMGKKIMSVKKIAESGMDINTFQKYIKKVKMEIAKAKSAPKTPTVDKKSAVSEAEDEPLSPIMMKPIRMEIMKEAVEVEPVEVEVVEADEDPVDELPQKPAKKVSVKRKTKSVIRKKVMVKKPKSPEEKDNEMNPPEDIPSADKVPEKEAKGTPAPKENAEVGKNVSPETPKKKSIKKVSQGPKNTKPVKGGPQKKKLRPLPRKKGVKKVAAKK